MYAEQRPIQLTLDWEREPSGYCPPSEVPIDKSFPEESANVLARLESFNKHLYRPNTYLHKWWARRSGTTFRHILKQLVTDPLKRGYWEAGGLQGALILDPMVGGGTTIHEAIRLGASAIGVDVDPIPVLQLSATLSYEPPSVKRRVFEQFAHELAEQVGRFFKTTCPHCTEEADIQFTLYAVRRTCACREVGLLDSYVLRQEQTHPIRICGTCHQVFAGHAHVCDESQRHRLPLLERTVRVCPLCGSAFKDALDIPFWQRYTPIAVVGKCQRHGVFHKKIEPVDLRLIEEANEVSARSIVFDTSQFTVSGGPKSKDLLARGVNSYLDLFSRRQLLLLKHAIQLLAEIPAKHRLWLGLLVSTSLEFNAMLCGYKGAAIRRPGAIRHVFSHHAYSFPYTALENNLIYPNGASGNLRQLFRDRVERASRWASLPVERRIRNGKTSIVYIKGEIDGGERVSSFGELEQGTQHFYPIQSDFRACEIPERCVDYIVTDPPYYDSVQYSNLSEFFRVWLRQMLPDEANWEYDPASSAVAEDASRGQAYGNALTAIWAKCNQTLRRPHGRLIFTFHHWNPDAWAELTLSLKRSQFALKNRYVVFSENPISVHILNMNSLKHDCVLVLAPKITGDEPDQWPFPGAIHSGDSRQLCLDSGAALGFFLQSDLNETQIRQAWKELLGGYSNGKTSR